jgi:hypothetical protein
LFFCIFLNENNTKSHDFPTVEKLKEAATIVVPWEIYLKRKLHILKEKLALTDYKRSLIDYKRLQKVGHGLQSLLIDNK